MITKILTATVTLLLTLAASLSAQVAAAPAAREELTIEKIMQSPLQSVGTLPSEVRWSEDGRWVYFMWNPEEALSDSLYKVSREGGTPVKVPLSERKTLTDSEGDYSRDYSKKVYARNGDIFLLDIAAGRLRRLTETLAEESDPRFTFDEKAVSFVRDDNLFLWYLNDSRVVQLTDFRPGKEPRPDTSDGTANERWLQTEEKRLFTVLRERERRERLHKERVNLEDAPRPKKLYIGDQAVQQLQLSPDQRFITAQLVKESADARETRVPSYVTRSGFTEELTSRVKVGSPQPQYKFAVYDTQLDSLKYLPLEQIPGINDLPPEQIKADGAASREDSAAAKPPQRNVLVHGPFWSDNGQLAMIVVRAADNKDRWIMLFDPARNRLQLLDRQHDDAWIGGPGISGWIANPGNVGWMPDNRRVWFQSEESGYSHLYTVDVHTGKKRALTSGRFEVIDAFISRNHRYWYLTTSEVHPGERHFYRMPIEGGPRTQITSMTGYNEVSLSPDEKMLAILYSYSNRPWQLYLMENKPGATARQVTDRLSEQFRRYPWRDPQIITFTARDGAQVYARYYAPGDPDRDVLMPANGPAVIFVHGAGYLQNVHKWWSSYFREYMFHNLLADHGYTVLDIDYRGSAGYGRNWRTAIYRHMGGQDLDDQVDAAKMLVEKYQVDPQRIGIYGGSYGGFITFMAMFTQPGVFACGAALRPVTDWAHYNHPYTSNILNEPQTDSLAYRRSSPIYFAGGLQGALLICHGMIDTNVHFQDVVRLVQRLIELGKDDWELAVYPLEGHGFKEPSSWTDEYKRVFKLFEEKLK